MFSDAVESNFHQRSLVFISKELCYKGLRIKRTRGLKYRARWLIVIRKGIL